MRTKKRPAGGTDWPYHLPGLPGSSTPAVQPQGYTGLAIVSLDRAIDDRRKRGVAIKVGTEAAIVPVGVQVAEQVLLAM